MQIRILYANIIFSYFSDMRLNFYSHNKKQLYPVRGTVIWFFYDDYFQLENKFTYLIIS